MRFLSRKQRARRQEAVRVTDAAIIHADKRLAELAERVKTMEGSKAVVTVRLRDQPAERRRNRMLPAH